VIQHQHSQTRAIQQPQKSQAQESILF